MEVTMVGLNYLEKSEPVDPEKVVRDLEALKPSLCVLESCLS